MQMAGVVARYLPVLRHQGRGGGFGNDHRAGKHAADGELLAI